MKINFNEIVYKLIMNTFAARNQRRKKNENCSFTTKGENGAFTGPRIDDAVIIIVCIENINKFNSRKFAVLPYTRRVII